MIELRPRAVLETVLYVDDLEAASDFYGGVLGLSLVHDDKRMKVFGVSEQNFLLLFRTGATLEPIEVAGGTIPPHDGKVGMHVAFTVGHDDIALWARQLRQNEIRIEGRVDWPSGETSLYVRDPAGNLVEFATPNLWTASTRAT